MPDTRFDDLRSAPLFQSLADADLRLLAEGFEYVLLETGEMAYQAGDSPAGFFVVKHGVVGLFGATRGQPLGRLCRGDFFGEIGLFDGLPRRETARAAEPSGVLRIERSSFLEFLSDRPLLSLKLELAAARGHAQKVQSELTTAKRRAVRYRINREILLRAEDGVPRSATIVDLSRLGVRLDGVPSTWEPGRSVRFALSWNGRSLRLPGQVAWRRQRVAGISFSGSSPTRDTEVRSALRHLLGGAPPSAS